jgi:starch-binding outer membrane protein, SusD/RagB family
MINKLTKLLFLGLIVVGISCKKNLKEFLDKSPGVDITEDVVFSNKANVEAYISTLYRYGMVSLLPNNDDEANSNPLNGKSFPLYGTLSGATDESENNQSFTHPQVWNSGSITNTNIISYEDNKYFARWKAIRVACILLERVDKVPGTDAAYKEQVKGEAKFMRALQNFELLKRYGGFPIVTKRFVNFDDAKIPRNSIEECVNAIVIDCDEAVTGLPVSYPASQRGRATKLAALALKSRTLLYAASPLFNTGTPYLSMANAADNKFICYGNADANRWKLAADAAKAVLDQAAGAGVSLIDVPSNRDPSVANVISGNYRTSWEKQDNTEIIIADKTLPATNRFNFPWYAIIPPVFGSYWCGNSVTFNFQKKYEKKTTGLPQTWDAAGGNDLTVKYDELDPRFKQTVAYVGSRWSPSYPIVETFTGGSSIDGCPGGAWMKKHVSEAAAEYGSVVPSMALFRLNEFYLNYAEALNEFTPGTAEAYAAVNTIRTRSGMPNLPAGLSQSAFRARVHNERDIELCFEDHRFWDIRRWMIAEEDGVMKGAMYGLKINKLAGNNAYSYLPYVFETRTFLKKMYLHPYDLNEVLKGGIVQNPGWD